MKPWLENAHFRGAQDRIVRLGFAPASKNAMESLARPNYRTFLEAILREVTGSEWKLDMKIVEGLSVPEKRKEAESAASRPDDPAGSFRDDPLIQEALEIFKGEIKSVTN
jgi:hypothetical protein